MVTMSREVGSYFFQDKQKKKKLKINKLKTLSVSIIKQRNRQNQIVATFK